MTDHTSNVPDLDDGYALDLTGPVQHIAAELAKADPEPVPVADLAASYSHFAGDLARVRKHEGLDNNTDATTWLIERAASELTQNGKRGRTQLTVEDGYVSLATGVKVEDLRWRGNPVYPPQDIHGVLGDPFNPMSGKYAVNVRKNTGKDTKLAELEASMRLVGWLPGHPAVKDARTLVTITGHRRLKVAAKLRAEGLDIQDDIKYVDFEVDGQGDPADIHRMDTAKLSNWGFLRPTPEERQETALWLSEERGMTQQQVAAVLGVSQQTVSRDLNKIITQMSNAELEPLITAAVAAIRRGLTQSQFGVERGMANNSMVLAKAFAVALDRIKREAEEELRLRDAATDIARLRGEVRDAIREDEEALAGDGPLDTIEDVIDAPGVDEFLDDPSTGTTREHPERQGLEDIEPAPEPPRAVNPPADLPPAPTPYDDPAFTEAWSWSDAADAWVIQRGRFWVTCQLPRDTQPLFPAPLFGVFTVEAAE